MGVLELNAARMHVILEDSDEKMIIWAFENGRYDVRKLAVDYFSKQKKKKFISLLQAGMHDETHLVSQTAMRGLELLVISPEMTEEIAAKRKFWIEEKEYREARRKREHLKTSVMAEPNERGSKRTMDNFRNMLRKPMNGGKWF
jgi:hypothetical protein